MSNKSSAGLLVVVSTGTLARSGPARTHRRRSCLWLPVWALVLAATFAACGQTRPPPRVHPRLDLKRYMGTWHEIARLPFYWERDCVGASAYYQRVSEDAFTITNYCWYKSFFGPMRKTMADAVVDDEVTRAKFKVEFIWPFFLDYWVLWVSDDYRNALVGTPDRDLLWLLSRDFQIPRQDYQKMVAMAAKLGFDTGKLINTQQHTNKAVAAEMDRNIAAKASGGRPAGDTVKKTNRPKCAEPAAKPTQGAP